MRKVYVRIRCQDAAMLATSDRLLRLLSLLQVRSWTGPELADRLQVTTRTVRNDIERVRRLGYTVESTPGPAGGYRLGPGDALPPLLLDDGEAVAVAVGLRLAASVAGVAGIEEPSQRALAKVAHMLPARLRHRVAAVDAATVTLDAAGPAVAADVLTTLAAACRDGHELRFDYQDHGGAASVRTVEPQRLVHARRRWYLVGWDAGRGDWRIFRADRIALPANAVGGRCPPRDPPGGDLVAYVTGSLAQATWRVRARVIVHAPAEAVAARLPGGAGVVVALDGDRCAYEPGADDPATLAAWLCLLGADFELVDGPPAVAEALAALADRLGRAAAVTPAGSG
jgi:predicted DNA-binding transcriptional regulator YafY